MRKALSGLLLAVLALGRVEAALPYSLLFGTATSDRVTIAPSSSNNALTARTIVLLVYPTAFNSSRALWTRLPNGSFNGFFRVSDTSGNIQFAHRRTASTFDYSTNSTPLKLNQWQWIAGTYDLSLGASVAHIYSAFLNAPWTEATYATSTQGSGTCDTSDSTDSIAIGNTSLGSPTVAFQGSIALYMEWNRALTIDELRFVRRADGRVPPRGLIAYLVLAANGRGTILDRSGSGNHGTLSGPVPTSFGVPRVPFVSRAA
jgi:hypothetical protein